MTCIVGISTGGRVWIGGDSAGVSGWSLTIRSDPKVFRVDGFAIGFTTSFRMGQLLAHAWSAPHRHESVDPYRHMVVDVVPSIRKTFEAGGWAEKKDGKDVGGDFLVGYAGRLFHIADDFQVGEAASGFAAVGCGMEVALGAMWVTGALKPKARVTAALQAAEALNAGVRGPFTVVEGSSG